MLALLVLSLSFSVACADDLIKNLPGWNGEDTSLADLLPPKKIAL